MNDVIFVNYDLIAESLMAATRRDMTGRDHSQTPILVSWGAVHVARVVARQDVVWAQL